MKRDKDYFKLAMRESRKKDREITERYRAWEHMPGESYSDFKKRFRAEKKK